MDDISVPRESRPSRPVFPIAKLKPGSTLLSAESFTKALVKRTAATSESKVSLSTIGERKFYWQKESLPILYLWMGIAVFILVIACANVVNLLLARGSKREKEIAVRVSLGARRVQIIRLLLVESLVLSCLGGMAGLVLSIWAKDIFGEISFIETAKIDHRVLIFTTLIALIAGIIAGIFPALQMSRTDLNTSLKQGGRDSEGGVRGQKIRSVLVVAEISLAVILLTGAALLIKGLILLMALDPGFQTHGILTFDLPLGQYKYQDANLRTSFYNEYLEKVQIIPGVQFAALSTQIPLLGADEWNVRLPEEADRKSVV